LIWSFGFKHFMQFVTELTNISDVILFLRTPKRHRLTALLSVATDERLEQ
jgi:hypothetical protein